MRSLILPVFISLLPVAAYAAANDRPQGKNCDLAVPPVSAGEEMNHGITMRIFPRARDIDTAYSGCQVTWLPDGAQWVVMTLVEIESGDPVRVYAPSEPSSPLFACRYKRGKVISGNADTCAAPQVLIHKSLAPGCVERIREAVASGRSRAGFPPGCDYE